MTNRKTIVIILVALAGLGVVTIGSCVGLLYMGYKNTDTAISPRIDSLFASIDDGTFSDTYETDTTQELKSVASKVEYAALGDMIGVRLGALKSKSMQGFNMRNYNGTSYIDVTFNATFENGTGTIFAKLKKENSVWKFASFRVNSPLFMQDAATMKCSSCDAPHAATAKFCPSCGAPVSATETGEPLPTEDLIEERR